jgi:hypothetical protein
MYWQPFVNQRFPKEREVLKWDVLPVAPHQKIAVDVLHVDIEQEHAVELTVYADRDGTVDCGTESERNLWLWVCEPREHLCDVFAPSGILTVAHGIRYPPIGDHPGHRKSDGDFWGMLVEVKGPKHLYRCNSGKGLGDTFDKLVFTVELLDSD